GRGCPSGPWTLDMSPMANTSLWPGSERSGSTNTRPARSSGTPSERARGEAATPAAHPDRVGGDPRHRRAGAHLHADTGEGGGRVGGQRGGEAREQSRPALDED